jgi:hypothetical protein
MQTPQNILPETIASMAKQLVGLDLPPDDQQRVADLLNALAPEIQAMRRMDVGMHEPSPTFEASEK